MNDVQHGKKVLMPYANSKDPDECAYVQSDLDILSLLTYTKLSSDCVSRKQRP